MSATNINRSLNHYSSTSSLEMSNNTSNLVNPARTRITRACDHCQLRKTKCDSAKPRCSQCVKRNDPCTFTTRVCKRGPKPKRLTYPYPGCKENLPQKSHNTYPYPSYFSLNRQPINLGSSAYIKPDFRRSSYPQQSSALNYNSPDHNFEFSTSARYNNQNLPPIQTSSPPSLISSSTISSINLRHPDLSNSNSSFKLPSLVNNLRLPPIRNLFGASNTLDYDRDLEQSSISSPSIYKLNTRKSPYPIHL
jgi:hypothetical protein